MKVKMKRANNISTFILELIPDIELLLLSDVVIRYLHWPRIEVYSISV